MKLKSPFNGLIFDQMFSEAVETVTGNLLKSRPQATASQIADLEDAARSVMLNTLDAVAFNGFPGYRFGVDNSSLVSAVATAAGREITLTETIVSEAYTDSATGEIPNWFGNPAQAVNQMTAEKANWQALQPSFVQRVAGTIFSPFGISGGTAIMYLEILAALAALVALAYVVRTFKKG